MPPFISEYAVPAARSWPLPVAGQSGVSCSPPDLGKPAPGGSVTSRPAVPVLASPAGQGMRSPQTGAICQRICVASGARTRGQIAIDDAKNHFFKLCQRRAINVTETFFKTLELCPNECKAQLLNKAACFFACVDTSKITSTGTLTGMIYRGKSRPTTGASVVEFVKVADADIQAVARSVRLRSISSMYNGRGFPKAKDVAALLESPILHTEKGLNERLLASISSMCAKKRRPELSDLEALLTLPSLQWAGRPSLKVLQIISNINHGRGIPTCQAVNDLLLLPCLREKGMFDMPRLRALSAMCRRRGFPEPGHVVSLFDLIERYGGLHKQKGLLDCFCSLYRNRGLPDPEEQLRLLLLPALQRDGQLDLELLAKVATSNTSSGFPTQEMVLQATGKLRGCTGSKLSLDQMKIAPASTAETSSVLTTVVLRQATMTLSGRCQLVPVAQGAVKPSPHGTAAMDYAGGSRLLNGDASIAEQERRGRINTIIKYLLDDDPSSAASIRPAYWTEELSSSAESEVLGWLEEIIKADHSSSGQCLGSEL